MIGFWDSRSIDWRRPSDFNAVPLAYGTAGSRRAFTTCVPPSGSVARRAEPTEHKGEW